MTVHSNPRRTRCSRRDFLKLVSPSTAALALFGAAGRSLPATQSKKTARRNIVLVLSDDHRYDFMRFMKEAPAFLETPNMDRMARQGAHLVNAFVSTSLC